MPLYYDTRVLEGGGFGRGGVCGSWCVSDFHLTLMMFIYFGENGKYTKCKRDRQVCVCVCVHCIIFLLCLPTHPLFLRLSFVLLCFHSPQTLAAAA